MLADSFPVGIFLKNLTIYVVTEGGRFGVKLPGLGGLVPNKSEVFYCLFLLLCPDRVFVRCSLFFVFSIIVREEASILS